MRISFAVLALAGVALGETSALAQRGRRSGQEAVRNGWLFNLNEGKKRALESGKPLMVVVRCVP